MAHSSTDHFGFSDVIVTTVVKVGPKKVQLDDGRGQQFDIPAHLVQGQVAAGDELSVDIMSAEVARAIKTARARDILNEMLKEV